MAEDWKPRPNVLRFYPNTGQRPSDAYQGADYRLQICIGALRPLSVCSPGTPLKVTGCGWLPTIMHKLAADRLATRSDGIRIPLTDLPLHSVSDGHTCQAICGRLGDALRDMLDLRLDIVVQ